MLLPICALPNSAISSFLLLKVNVRQFLSPVIPMQVWTPNLLDAFRGGLEVHIINGQLLLANSVRDVSAHDDAFVELVELLLYWSFGLVAVVLKEVDTRLLVKRSLLLVLLGVKAVALLGVLGFESCFLEHLALLLL